MNLPPRWVLYLPLAFFIVYLSSTVALFAFGPWRYPIADGRGLYSFLLLAHVALAAGYLSVRWKVPKKTWSRDAMSLLVKLCLGVTIVLLIPTSLLDTGEPIPNVIAGLAHSGEAYARSLELRSQRAFVFVSYIRILVGPLLFLLVPLLVVYWQDLSARVRILSSTAVAFGAAISIAEGVSKGLADLVGLFPILALTAHFSHKLRLTMWEWSVVAAVWVVALGFVVGHFGATQASRTGSASEYGSLPPFASTIPTPIAIPASTPLASPAPTPIASPAPTAGPHTPSPTPTSEPAAPIQVTYPGGARSISVDYHHPLVRIVPRSLRTMVVGGASYLTQGYYGLYLSLGKPFVPMFGVGNSLFLTQQAVRVTGKQEIAHMSYPSRIQQEGWDPLGRWSSIYPWIASDVSFPGTIVVVFLIGRFFAKVWFDALSTRNPFAIGMVAQFAIMLFYFPANNQTSQFGEEFTAFWGILTAWLLTRNGLITANVRKVTRRFSQHATGPSGADPVRPSAQT